MCKTWNEILVWFCIQTSDKNKHCAKFTKSNRINFEENFPNKKCLNSVENIHTQFRRKENRKKNGWTNIWLSVSIDSDRRQYGGKEFIAQVFHRWSICRGNSWNWYFVFFLFLDNAQTEWKWTKRRLLCAYRKSDSVQFVCYRPDDGEMSK